MTLFEYSFEITIYYKFCTVSQNFRCNMKKSIMSVTIITKRSLQSFYQIGLSFSNSKDLPTGASIIVFRENEIALKD